MWALLLVERKEEELLERMKRVNEREDLRMESHRKYSTNDPSHCHFLKDNIFYHTISKQFSGALKLLVVACNCTG